MVLFANPVGRLAIPLGLPKCALDRIGRHAGGIRQFLFP
jgi:hypothetical protein